MTCLFFARLNLFITFLQLSAGNLDEFLNYYETLHHDDLRHQIKRRDLYTKNPTERIVEFDAHGKHFKLVLHKNTSVLSSDFKVSVVGSREKRSAEVIDTTIYKGYVDDEPTTSSVSAYWDDDQHFTATISTESETFVVEPSWRHLPDSPDYTLISYKGSDMKQNNEKSTNPFCGVASHTIDHGKPSDAKETLDGMPNLSNKDRAKRDAHPACPQSRNKACPVLLVADFRFYQVVGGSDLAKTAKYMIGVLDEADHLFRRHTFGDCGSGFGFVIKQIFVHDRPSKEKDHYNNADSNFDKSEDLLWNFSSHSEEKISYADFCLVHLFTARRFLSNVLGISELAQPTASPSGGLCSGFRKPRRSMNTGWTTFLGGNGQRVLKWQAYLVVAHEFGHAWGSGHEFPNSTRCNPNTGGKYLMFVYAVTGREQNNMKFSSCSIEAIRDVLVYKAQVCFVNADEARSLCGNYKLDAGEKCDEGPVGGPCCTSSCQFKDGKVCSDVHQPCCEKCQVANASRPCRETTVEPCSEIPYCNGHSSSCPTPAAKVDGAPCENKFRGVCVNQTCTSICEYNNKTQCTCDSVELSCRICCRDTPNENDTCKVYRGLNETMNYINVSDNTYCPIGLCSNGVCTKVTDTSVKRSWSFIEIRSFSHFVVFMKNNIVGTVIVLSLLLWIPASCTVSYIDRKRAKESKESKKDMKFISSVLATNLLVSQNEQNRVKIKLSKETLDRKTTIRARPA